MITDPTSDAQSARDIVGDAANPTAYVYSDGTYLYFRLRVDSDPLQAAPANYRPFGWACLMDTDGNLQSYEFVAGVDGIANPDIVDFRQNTSPTFVGDPSDDAETQLASYPPLTHARSVPAPSNFLGTPDFFIDWAINLSDLVAAGVTAQTPLRFICGTSNNARSLVADLISATGATTLPDLSSDPILCGPTGCSPVCAGFGQACSTGQQGVCAAGTTTCNGSTPVCTPNTPASPETCDGLDNDCDGATDNGNPGGGVACSTGQQGVCAAGTTTCSGGSIQCNANVGPSSETCDSLDNNCDGTVDDGFNVGATCTNGVGACQATGAIACDGYGGATCNAVPGSPSPETCDGVDNNCDGSIDEGNPGGGMACSTGQQGVCAAGTTTCTGGAIQCTPNTAASAETCDGLDNDCDGTNDDGFNVGMPCTEGVGACMDTGVFVCDGAGGATCDATPGSPSAEICGDGVDNNCDGTTDEQCADTDGDGLTDVVEEQLGTDPNDADTDNDGVPDGEEPLPGVDSDGDGLINALDPDSDDDGLFDGTELGYDCSGPGTDASLGHCIPDGDGGATTTDPLDADTDDGGVADGSEDIDRDGVVDAGETDPTAGNGADDGSNDDSDGDGLSDDLEGTLGTDPNDADTDDDGVLDGQEANPADDHDGDGIINALDEDADGDGLFDGTELGLGCDHPDTDQMAGNCVPDADGGATTTNPLDADTDDGGVSDGDEDANHNGAVDAGETDPTAGNGADDMPAAGCTDDSECGDPTSGMVCDDATQTCIPGCRGANGNGCPDGEVCSSTDETIGTCEPPAPECAVDADCGGATSGQVCDPATLACVQGCRGADGNSCPIGLECTSTDDAIGTCFSPEGLFVEGSGCVCAARPSQGSGAAWLALPAALALLGARRRRRSQR